MKMIGAFGRFLEEGAIHSVCCIRLRRIQERRGDE